MHDQKRREWLKVTLVSILVAACLFVTIWFHYVSDVSYVFPNFFYIPIILACLWWDRKGVVLAAFLAVFLVLSSAFSPGEQPLWDDAVRAGIFLLIALVIAELSARRKELIDTLEEKVQTRTAELKERNEELETFSYAVSHDLTGSLATLHGYAEVARDIAAGKMPALEEESLEAIEAISSRMSHYIMELLEYARAGRHEGEVGLVSVYQAAAEVIEDLASLRSGKNVEVSIEDGLPDVRVEEVLLRQVLSNLVANSIKHGAGNGPLRIEIGWYKEGDADTFFVRDDGVGIDREQQEEVFKDFTRMDSGDKTPGLGLGLSIVKRAVEGWGGRVWLESSPGEGATFYFTVPTQNSYGAKSTTIRDGLDSSSMR